LALIDLVPRGEMARIKDLAASEPELELLLLFGSRARDDARTDSDWDFGYIGGNGFAPEAFIARLVGHLGTERVDWPTWTVPGPSSGSASPATGRWSTKGRPGPSLGSGSPPSTSGARPAPS